MPQKRERKRIAIVGGGCAAMAAAWDLTSRKKAGSCDVTIFQMGGRLGGKAASSRNAPGFGDRIEEHGLHLWLGYYETRSGWWDLLRGAPGARTARESFR